MHPLRWQEGRDVPEYILVISHSGRMLAAEIAKTGIKSLVIDLYADVDTRYLAVDCIKIPSLAPAHLAPALDYFCQSYPVEHVIYGSGFENHPESLYVLNERMIILGNSPEIFSRLQRKIEFFSVLADLNIDFPEVAFSAPQNGEQWLIKPMQGQGGVGIRRYEPDTRFEAMSYWQRVRSGTAHSALFLADGQKAQAVGFNFQWTRCWPPDQEFIFSGVINDCDLSIGHREQVKDWIARCVPAFGLKGLNSLDFIRTDGRCLCLEINARPPASMQLYDDLLMSHILAVQGVLAEHRPDRNGCTGLQIVYADHDWMVPFGLDWPEECVDRPAPGAMCRKGQPVCSIIARHCGFGQVLDRLSEIQQQIVNKMIKV